MLDGLSRCGVNYPNSCRAGICQSCLSKSVSGAVDPAWQVGIQDTLRAQNYFLACLAKPEKDIDIAVPNGAECSVDAIIQNHFYLSNDVLALHLRVEDLSPWTPGQYINFVNSDGVIRSYSIANCPTKDGFIELHIKLQNKGVMSDWLRLTARKDMTINIRGPMGNCFYHNPKDRKFDMLLVGTGTGLAPLIAIARDALLKNHKGTITLIHGGRSDSDIYYLQALMALAASHNNFQYKICVLKSNDTFPEDDIANVMLNELIQPESVALYVCGPEETTQLLKKKAFIAGVPSAAILSDSFIMSQLPKP